MVLDVSLMNSLEPVFSALSDRLNRISRIFEHLLNQAILSRHSLDECAIPNCCSSQCLTRCSSYLTVCDDLVKVAMQQTSDLLQPRSSDLADFSQTIFITVPQDPNWDFLAL